MLIFSSTLRYQTGTASLIQLAVVVFLVVINNLVTLVGACSNSNECAMTALFSMIFIVMTAIWFFVLSAIGYAAQERRSRKLAFLLIAGQLATIGIAYGFLKHPANWFGGLSAFVVLVVAVWIIVLAWRLAQARGGRVVARTSARPRKRLVQHSQSVDTDHKNSN